MQQLLEIKDLDEDVEKTHPWLKSLSFVKSGIKEFGKKNFYKSLKFHYFVFDTKSPYRSSGYTEEQLRKEMSVGVYGTEDTEFITKHKEWIQVYNLSPLEKEFEKTRLEVEGFNVMLEEWPWDQTSAQNRIKTITAFETFYVKFQQLGKQIQEETTSSVGRANSEPTFLEKQGMNG